MALENIKRKIEAEKKAKPYTRKAVNIGPDGKTREITERVSLAELLADDDEEYIDNPEDPEYRRMMEGEW
ncbi:hypothetical protein ACFLXF_00455 [Chloroflexota bacterium]